MKLCSSEVWGLLVNFLAGQPELDAIGVQCRNPVDSEAQRMQDPIMNESEEKLKAAMAEFGCQTGTLHRAEGEWLHLVAYLGVPEFLLDKITKIPFGKGIAGVAAATREPVELCNLQQDLGGVAKEDARKTGVSGSLAVAILSDDGEKVLGTIGVGKVQAYEFSDAEKARLAEIGRGCRGVL